MKNLLTYNYRTKNEGDKIATFELTSSECIKITIEGKSMEISFLLMVDMLANAATELRESSSPGAKRRAIALLISDALTPMLNHLYK